MLENFCAFLNAKKKKCGLPGQMGKRIWINIPADSFVNR